MKILILNGPNLNLLGTRETEWYGNQDFDTFLKFLKNKHSDLELFYQQSNHEGALIDALHEAKNMEGIILNAAAYTHTSLAIADAIKAIQTPVIEVHISNIFQREKIRHRSLIAPHCLGSIVGLGLKGYDLAIQFFKEKT